MFLAPVGPELAIGALTDALAPFDANDYGREPYDPDEAWDWWHLPARIGLPLRREHLDDQRVTRAVDPDADPIVVAAPKAIIDFDAMRREAREHAAGTWDA